MSKKPKAEAAVNSQLGTAAALIISGDYDPFGGLGHALSPQDQLTELARSSAAVADGVIDGLCQAAVEEARRNALLVFVDGFGLTHSLDSADMAVNWVERIWDRGIDSY